MEKIIIAGMSGHAKVLIDIVEQARRYEIVGLTDPSGASSTGILGYPVLGKDEDIPHLMESTGVMGGLVGVGDNWRRQRASARIESLAPQFRFVTAIHPSACIARDASVEDGTVIMAGATVGPSTRVGRFCVLNTGAILEHDCTLGDFASLAPRVATGGNCRLGQGVAVGIGAVVSHGVTIGEHSVVGAGATVLQDLPPFQVAYGTPARVIRGRKPGDAYL